MKNTEYITMPSPELVDDYVNKVQIDLLEKIKAEINEKDRAWMPKSFVNKIFDNHIKELKGENNEQI